MSESVFIFTVDGGTTSGVACGEFPVCVSAWDGLTQGKWESWDVVGPTALQAWEIVGEYSDRVGGVSHRRVPKRHSFVVEDFVVRLGPGAGSKRELLDPVRVASACEALSWQRPKSAAAEPGPRWFFIDWQQPSQAKTFATNQRLRKHGLWERGVSDHRRDAVRHMALRYSLMIGEQK